MPASYVHQCVARRVSETLSLYTEKSLLNAMLAGSEGPDPLFFSVLTLDVPRAGSVLHTQKTDEFLLALCDACKDSALTRAYCCGFFTHYAADTTFHPFIYAHSLTEEGGYSSTAHCTLEHQLETLHYRRQGHKTGLPVQMAGFSALSGAQKDEIARAFTQALLRVFPGETITLARVRRSFEDSTALCRMLRSPRGVKFSVLGALLRPFHMDAPLHAHMMPVNPPERDIMNDAHRPWCSLWAPDTVRTESFDDLFIQAAARACELVRAADGYMLGETAYATLRMLHGGYSYDSGLPWQSTCSAREASARMKR